MRRKLVAGNWKMYGSRRFVAENLKTIRDAVSEFQALEKAICPTFIHLPLAEEILGNSGVEIGAQNVYCEAEGAFTGEVSAPMLVEYSVRFVIVGHSERRQLFGETDELVARKFAAVQASDMMPILCLGETLEQREAGQTNEVVLAQLDAVLQRQGIEAFRSAVIAYEPIWAIGTGKTATPDQAQDVHAAIRGHLCGRDEAVGEACRVLYGGSVKPDNAAELFARPDIDGGLVGGASLKADDFAAICQSAG